MTELSPGAEFISASPSISSPNAGSASGAGITARSAEEPVTKSDLRKLQSLLLVGDDSVARRKDLGELHKRIVSLFTTLNQGLDDQAATKAAEDRAQIDARLERMERAVNSMEGALRIELAPLLKAMVLEATQTRPVSRPLSNGAFSLIVMALIGTAIGALIGANSAGVQSAAQNILALLNFN